MKIEFLNDDCTEARLTRGWFRKRVAHVRRGSVAQEFWLTRVFGSGKYCRPWSHQVSATRLSERQSAAIEEARECLLDERKRISDWVPLRALPQAKALK